MVRQFPPERFPAEFVAFKEAYEVLSDAGRREKYDSEQKKQTELAGDLPVEALLQIEHTKAEIQKTHTGKAVQAARELYAQYPDNAAVISLLQKAYIARGWKNKAMELALDPAFQKTLKTVRDWEAYASNLYSCGFSEAQILVKSIEGITAFAQTGKDDIEICAWVYYDFMEFERWDLSGIVVLPEKFETPDKLLLYISQLSERGLKPADPEEFISNVLMPITEFKSPSELDDRDVERLHIILNTIHNAIDAAFLKKSMHYDLIQSVEYYLEHEAKMSHQLEPVRSGEKTGRNDPCPCGSGKKYKKCCGR
jgi:hypothetical protein